MSRHDHVCVGVDVGGPRKGFHAVALRGSNVVDCCHSLTAEDVGRWCEQVGAGAVAIDAPCRWSSTGRARAAERALAKAGVFAFATPSYETAASKLFYSWMLNGAKLYALIEADYKLFDGSDPIGRFCIETFPQAVACALAGCIVSAKEKKTNRPVVLQAAGLSTDLLTSMDYVDAGLCALTARYVHMGSFVAYGDEREGFIVVPKL